MLNRRDALGMGLALAGYAATGRAFAADAGFVTLLDGTSFGSFHPVGTANWRIIDGAAYADYGTGFLVSDQSYQDFQLRAEVWTDMAANSGIFIRCTDPNNISAADGYECNIFDTRPDQTYATGAIVNVAKGKPGVKAANKWNVMEIMAKGPQMTIRFNGTETASGMDTKNPRGRIALQYGAGVVKFRKVEVKAL